jgi:hypothetical protein
MARIEEAIAFPVPYPRYPGNLSRRSLGVGGSVVKESLSFELRDAFVLGTGRSIL